MGFTSGSSAINGDLIGDSAQNGDGNGAGAGNQAWGIYANSGGRATASSASFATLFGRVLNQVGDSVSIDFDNGTVDNNNSNGDSSVRLAFGAQGGSDQMVLKFTRGLTRNDMFYEIIDGTGTSFTTIPITDDGFNVKLTLTDLSGGYSLTAGSTAINSRTLTSGTASINFVSLENLHAGASPISNLYFNNLEISAVPEISPIIAIPFALAFIVVPATFYKRRKVNTGH
jgi:hypothetical protein